MIPPERNQNPEEENQTPNTGPDRDTGSTADSGNRATASTPNEAADRVRSAALSADHSLRSGVDRVRPAAQRLGERLLQWLAPLLRWLAPRARRVRQRLDPQISALRRSRFGQALASGDRSSGRGPSRVRAMQVGAAAAAVGIVGVVIGNAGSGAQEQDVQAAAQTGELSATSSKQVPLQSQEEIDAPESTQPEAAAKPGPPAEGIDVSNHNGDADWQKVKADGKSFAFVLASDGENFSNQKYDEQVQGAKDAGLMTGAYHFGRPTGSATQQADRLLQTSHYQNDGKTLPPTLDLEVNTKGDTCYGKSPEELSGWVKEFTDKVKKETGRDPIIYSSTSFWSNCMGDKQDFQKNPLWLASYGVDDPKVPGGWPEYTFHQYTSKGEVDGISGSVDQNKFAGSEDQLKAFAQKK